ncbi:MAG: PTS fructose transporter subunit IIC, partial [Bacilli bacterium]
AMGLLESGVYGPNTAAQVAIIVPALGYGIASLISKQKFSPSFKNAGNASLIMGLVGVSEGAIPFTLANPKLLVFVNMLGCAVAAAFAVGFNAVNKIPISGIYGWLLVDNWIIYVIAIIIGSAIVAGGALLTSQSFTNDANN